VPALFGQPAEQERLKLSAILVHYHTPDLLLPAVAALQRDAANSAIELECLVVDNGSCSEDQGVWRDLPARRLDPQTNLGYAGAVNLGFAEASADYLLAMNPDVEVLPGCLTALSGALEQGAGAAGPRFWWDHERQFQLPPTEPRTRRDELLAVLARRGNPWARWARRRWRQHAERWWAARCPLPTFELSGALLAISRQAWRQIGPFDDRYQLYFEETDWLCRLQAAGLGASFVPAAEAVHLYAQSSVAEPRASEWFDASSRRFRRRRYGAGFERLLRILDRTSPQQASPRLQAPPRGAVREELSASPWGFPAALRTPASMATELPEELWSRLGPGTYYRRFLAAGGRELGVQTLKRLAVQPEAQNKSLSPMV